MKIIIVIGTRPEAIKMAPIAKMAYETAGVEALVVSTGQHKEMLHQTCKALDMRVDIDLELMRAGNSLSDVAGDVLKKMDKVVQEHKPDWILVQGDTATAFAGGLAGFYNKVKVGHVEAGLRSFDNYNPFPEEVNRRLIAAFADVHFAPTDESAENLRRENISPEHILVTGNTVIDALQCVRENMKDKGAPESCREDKVPDISPDKKTVLVTSHRRENHGEALENICEAIKELATARDDLEFIYPLHLNPNVRKTANAILQGVPRVHLIEPLSYLSIVYLMDKSFFILTDSGGIQEEATAFSTPVLVLRDTTERMEGVHAGVAKLIGTNKKRIIDESLNLLDNPAQYASMQRNVNPYGDGFAAKRIIDYIITHN